MIKPKKKSRKEITLQIKRDQEERKQASERLWLKSKRSSTEQNILDAAKPN